MQAQYNLNSASVDGSRVHLWLENRFPWTTSSMQAWRRNDQKNGQGMQLSTGGGVAVVVCLTVALLLVVLATVFVVFRKRYGPQYTMRSFFAGRGTDRTGASRDPTPASVESGARCKETDPAPSRQSTILGFRSNASKDSPRMSGPMDQTRTPLQHHSRPSATVPDHLCPPPRVSHSKAQSIGRIKIPPIILHRTDPRAATEQLKVPTPTSPGLTPRTTGTQSSGALPSMYRTGLGSRKNRDRDTLSTMDSDRVVSLPSPSPLFRHILRPSPKPESSYVCNMRIHQP